MSDRKVDVRLDKDLCIGNAMCRANAPRSFEAEPDGQSRVTDPMAEDLPSLLEAAASCPVAAITVIDVESGETIEPPW